jgi:hypothetical protein
MAMAVVAVLGAAAAFCAARAEQDAARLEHKLNQGQMFFLTIRQEALDKSRQHKLFVRLYQQYEETGTELKGQASLAGYRNQASKAALLELKAQESYRAALSLMPLLRVTELGFDEKPEALNENLDRYAEERVQELGFDPVWVRTSDSKARKSSIWRELEQKIHDTQQLIWRLASSVVVFVLALVCFTLSQLFNKKPQRRLWLTGLGVFIAIVGIIYAGWTDLASWETFGRFGAWIPILLVAGWIMCASAEDWESLRASKLVGRFVARAEARPWIMSGLQRVRRVAEKVRTYFLLADSDEEEELEKYEEFERPISPVLRIPFWPAHHRLGRWVVCSIAGTALLSAASALLYTNATLKDNQATSKVFDYQIEEVKAGSELRLVVFSDFEEIANVLIHRTLAWSGEYRAFLEARTKLAVSELDDAEIQIDHEQRKFENVDQDLLGRVNGPLATEEETYPDNYLIPRLTMEPAIHFAQADGEHEAALVWQKKSTAFLRTLTLLAIALYLLGQSLGLGHTRGAFILAFYAFALSTGAGLSLICTVYTVQSPDDKSIQKAAESYGEGMVDYLLGNYMKAVEDFGYAVDKRANFALANYYLAQSKFRQIEPQREKDIQTVSKEALSGVVRTEEIGIAKMAEQELTPPVLFIARHAFHSVLLGLSGQDRANAKNWVEHGIEETNEALNRLRVDNHFAGLPADKNALNSELQFLLGMALLANGEQKAGLASYDRGFSSLEQAKRDIASTETGYTDTSRAPIYDDVDELANSIVSNTLILKKYCTLLNRKDYCDRIDTEVEKVRTRLMSETWREQLTSSAAQLSNVTLNASPAGLGWTAELLNFEPKKDRVSFQWYSCDSTQHGACDADSDKANLGDEWNVWLPMPGFNSVERGGNFDYEHPEKVGSFVRNFNKVGLPRCLDNGEYRLNLYLNGHTYSGEVSLNAEPYRTATVRDLNMALCHPSNWIPQSLPKVSKGMMRGFANKDKNRGVYVFSFYSPESNPNDQLKTTFTQVAERLLVDSGYIKQFAPLTTDFPSCIGEYPGPLSWAGYQLNGETVLSKVWSTWDGTVYVGLAVRGRSADSFNEQEKSSPDDCGVLRSLTNLYGSPLPDDR